MVGHIARAGVETMISIVVTSATWVGLNRMLMLCSMPNTVCHTASAPPAMANPTTATVDEAYPRGIAWKSGRPERSAARTVQPIQAAVAANPSRRPRATA